jgi:multiple antibiotic resistance protein
MQAIALLPEALGSFVNSLLIVVAALFPIVNPLGMAPIFLSYTAGADAGTRDRLARRVAYNSFALATVSLIAGSYILHFFGLSLPAVQIGGGLVVAATGWRILHRGADDPQHRGPAPSPEEVLASAFYPLTMPLTVGPGSIAVMLAIGSNAPAASAANDYLVPHAIGGLAGVAIVALSIYLSYRYAEPILRRLGDSGVNVFLRLSAFILLCIGVQILLNGYHAIAQAS